MNESSNIIEIDIFKLIRALLKRLWAIILAGVICGLGAFGFTYATVDPTYQSSALLYVNNTDISLGNTSFSISSGTLTAAQQLVDTYIVILKARTTLNSIIEYAGVERTYKELKEMITAAPVDSTEIFEIVVTSTDPQEAEVIANAIAKILPQRISDIVNGSSVKIVDYAIIPTSRSGPSYTKSTILGIAAGMFIVAAIIVVLELFDVYIRDEQYLTQTFEDIPTLAVIPDYYESKTSSNAYGYGNQK